MQVNGYLKKLRVYILCALAAVFALYVFYKYAVLAFKPVTEQKTWSPLVQRGSIFDKNGKPLAVSTNFYHVGVTPSSIKDLGQFARLFAPVLELSETELTATIAAASNSSFVYIKKKIDQNTYELLRDITDKNGLISAVRFDRIPGRVYPENNLASQVIGYMGNDGTGLAGIEYTQQNTLSPPVNPEAPVDVAGKNVYLTLDANLQFKLEKVARDAITKTQAASLMLIAAEAKTGEILSYISLPSVNLNEYTTASQEEMKDRPATESYEPGSVFKIFSIANFFDSGAISENDIFLCDGIYEKRTNSGERIKITCLDHHGWITARDALKYSCNDALAQMSEKIESEQFLARIRNFGFGSKTGIELPGETAGAVRNTSDRFWSARSKPTIAIGQEISVSALQMVQAATAIANGGSPARLTLIKKITSQSGVEEYVHQPALKNQVISEKTARYILSCMQTVAQAGTGSRANLGDISIGVKTGTAQMADPVNGGYSKTDFISNCIAIFPVEKPEIILYIVIEKAKGETYAGRIVAPVIGEAASIIIDHLGMSRGGAASLAHNGLIKIESDAEIKIGDKVPDFTGLPKRSLLQLLNRKDIKIKINGNGWVTDQNPKPGETLTQETEIELYLE
jgi:cell division protein FtsI (penicillin-binding protein 3)